MEDKKGHLWISTNGGVSEYDGKTFTNHLEGYGATWSIYADSKGRVWAGTEEGVFRFDGTAFEKFELPASGVKENEAVVWRSIVWSFAEDKEGNIWFARDGDGLCKYDGKNFTHLTNKDGLCTNAVGALMIDRNGVVWSGSFNEGLSRYDGKKF